MQPQKILITGASGFIGSHLTRAWVQKGADVYVLTRYISQVKNLRLLDIWSKLNFIEGDIRNLDSLKPLREMYFDKIFHLAAYNHVGDSFLHVNENLDTNGKGTANLLESCLEFGRFIYVSSSEVYGKQDDVPFHEENTPCPISPYSVGKYSGELYCKMKYEVTGKAIALLRPFNTFGPYQSEKAVIPELITRCLLDKDIITTEGKQTREFNFVSNIVDGLIMASESEVAIGRLTNLGSGEEISIKDLVATIHEMTVSESRLKIGELPYRPIEIWRMSASNQLAMERFGWRPKLNFQQGLEKTIAWFKNYVYQFNDPNANLSKLAADQKKTY